MGGGERGEVGGGEVGADEIEELDGETREGHSVK
jgi:hypothetical protein